MEAVPRPGRDIAGQLPAPPAELRRAHRFTLLMRTAKLIVDGSEYLCVIRDVSRTGVAINLFHPMPSGGELVIAMQNGDRLPVNLVWEADSRAGFRFCGDADIDRILESPSAYPKRPIRAAIERPGQVLMGPEAVEVTLNDISQQGAKIACDAELAIDRKVRLVVSGLPDVVAKVRWRGEGACGLVFENTFQLDDLARRLAAIHRL